jgi:hypothetical protein
MRTMQKPHVVSTRWLKLGPITQPRKARHKDMNQQEATRFVIRQLGRHQSRNDIIRGLCERGRFDWRQAEQFVYRVENEHRRQIAARQMPFILFVAFATIIGGVVFVAIGGFYFSCTGSAMVLGGLIGIVSIVYRLIR